MADEKKPQLSPTTIAALLAGLGLGAGTEVIIRPPIPEEPGWNCLVMADNQVFCKPVGGMEIPPDDLVVRDRPDAGSADGGVDGGVP